VLCQEQNTVPIVESEVPMDADHSIEQCEEVMDAVLTGIFPQLALHRVQRAGTQLRSPRD
jgi:fructose-bisphosphate aldolase, class I